MFVLSLILISSKSLANFFEDETLSPILDDLILITALPLASMEKTGAIDATGFSTSNFHKWNDYKWGVGRKTGLQKEGKERVWRKLHAVVGCKSNVFISAKVTEKNVADVSAFEEVLGDKTKYFELEDFVADKAYSSRKVLNFLNDIGLSPIIPFRKNAVPRTRGDDTFIWRRMLYYFREHEEEFNQRYHKRSNVETSFHMIKKRFGNDVKTKSFQSNVNEIKMKCLCHNICVLIQEMCESGIAIDFQSCVNTINSV